MALPSSESSVSLTDPQTTSGLKSSLQNAFQQSKALIKNNAGLLLIASSELFFASMFTTVKILERLVPSLPTLELVAVRMIVTYTCCLIFMLATKVPEPFLGPRGIRGLLLLRGFCGFVCLFAIYFGLQYLSISDAVVLNFLTPVCTLIAGALLLGEKIRRTDMGAGLLSLVGVVLIARPSFLFGGVAETVEGVTQAQRLLAVAVILVGVTGCTGEYITLRSIGNRAHSVHCIAAFSLTCVLVSCSAMLIVRTPLVLPREPVAIALLLLIGVFGLCGQTFLTLGLQRETAGRGSLGMYTQIIFATFLDRLVLGVTPHALSIAGTAIILSCALYVALTKEAETQEKARVVDDMMELEEGLLSGHDRSSRRSSTEGSEVHSEREKLPPVDTPHVRVPGDT